MKGLIYLKGSIVAGCINLFDKCFPSEFVLIFQRIYKID